MYPYPPIDKPLQLPGPDAGQFCFSFDAKWMPIMFGLLQTLLYPKTWENPQDGINQASLLIEQFMLAAACPAPEQVGLEGDDCMGCCLRWSDTGALQVFTCGVWTDVPGPGARTLANGSQPAQGAPQPSAGGCENFIGKVLFFGRWLLPVPVSAGDQITVNNTFGATTDYIHDYPGWKCGDGTEFIAGGCLSGSAGFNAGDPAPAFHHANLIGFDGTNYYDFGESANSTPVTITVLPGISNANFALLINSEGPAGAGDLSFDIRVCKAAAVPLVLTGFGAGSGAPATLSVPSMNVGDTVFVTTNLNPSSGLYDGGFNADHAAHWKIVSVSGFTVATGCPWEWNGSSCESGAPDVGHTSPGAFTGWNGNSSTQPTVGLQLLSVP